MPRARVFSLCPAYPRRQGGAGFPCPRLAVGRIHAPASALSPWPLAGLNGHVRGARRGLGWLAPALRRAGVLPCCVLLLLLFGPLRFGGWCCGRRCGRCGAGWRGLRIAVRGVAGRRAVRWRLPMARWSLRVATDCVGGSFWGCPFFAPIPKVLALRPTTINAASRKRLRPYRQRNQSHSGKNR